MNNSKDLSWLSAPAFFLIIGMIYIHTKNQNIHSRQQEKLKTHLSAAALKKIITGVIHILIKDS